MKTLSTLMQEVIQLTTEIETNYPELYQFLEETPLEVGEAHPYDFLGWGKSDKINTHDLKEYLETLKSQLKHHIETHGKK